MNPNDPLAALNPLREPAPISAWPYAPGWWLLAVLLLTGIAALLWVLVQRRRRNLYRRQGLAALAVIEQRYAQMNDPLTCVSDVNRVLKTVALHAYPDENVAALHGYEWVTFLETRAARAVTFDPAFADFHYRKPGTDFSADALLQQAQTWIAHHKVSA
ncbi:DUF4381 domain-containing protein [Halioglobus maricola]|uniref:DUF4381 domain-containing protein n=1 Tax=Halioglobus maricola TaxID=2601894 RepID=UPI001478A804|nr:DUF4381 domain-containing protein [Halioglobus maricola]